MTHIDKTEALAPCPFCGGEAKLKLGRGAWGVLCTCGGKAFIHTYDGGFVSTGKTTDEAKASAIAAWNRRAALPARGVGVKPWGWIGGNAACHHAHVNELAEGLQSCTSCGAVRSAALSPAPASTDAAQAREDAARLLLDMLYMQNGAHEGMTRDDVQRIWDAAKGKDGYIAVDGFLRSLISEART